MEWCETAAEKRIDAAGYRIDIGIDVARYGDDSSVLYPLADKAVSRPFMIYHHNRTTEIAGYAVMMIKQFALRENAQVIRVKVDCDGLGVGVYDNLYDLKDHIVDEVYRERCIDAGADPVTQGEEIPRLDLEIQECHFGGAGGRIDEEDPVEYSNSTGLMCGKVRKYLQEGKLSIPNDDLLFTQLTNRKYTVNKDGKLELERKESMKKRGLQSPDIADALALALYDPDADYNLYW